MHFSRTIIFGLVAASQAASLPPHVARDMQSRSLVSGIWDWLHNLGSGGGSQSTSTTTTTNSASTSSSASTSKTSITISVTSATPAQLKTASSSVQSSSKTSTSSVVTVVPTVCPPVWKQVKTELNTLFMSGNQCNDLARAAIRAAFHDCGTWDSTQGFHGGCDGSLFVGVTPDVELNRTINLGLQRIAPVLTGLASKYGTSVADMIVFAANAATVLCPGGPAVTTYIGRADNTTSAPAGLLPDVNSAAADIVNLFAAKGLSATDLAALLGAHSTATQLFVNTASSNASLDTTPGAWDVVYYQQTYNYATTGQNPSKIFVLPSDQKLATFSSTSQAFQGFINNQGGWNKAYQSAMAKMVVFGNNKNNMVDCTSALNA